MAFSVDDLIGQVKPPVRSVTICIDQSLQAQHDELVELLEQERRAEPASKMGSRGKAREVADRIGEVEAAMRKHLRTFQFRGLNQGSLQALYARFPAKDDNALWDMVAGGPALVAAAAVEPAMTEEQAQRLFDVLSAGQSLLLVGTAHLASMGTSSVPLSERASELRRGNA